MMSYSEDTIRTMLPKAYLRKHVAHEVYVALTFFKGLRPVMEDYVYNDGTTKKLMSLSGTIPIIYSDKKFNIPVCLWIEDNYPQTAPICYVMPTREMMVVKREYISNNGLVRFPYLKDWKNECDLVSLLQVMVAMFGEFPPVCMRPQSEMEQAPCRLQFHREADKLTVFDGKSYLPLKREDGQTFQREDESDC